MAGIQYTCVSCNLTKPSDSFTTAGVDESNPAAIRECYACLAVKNSMLITCCECKVERQTWEFSMDGEEDDVGGISPGYTGPIKFVCIYCSHIACTVCGIFNRKADFAAGLPCERASEHTTTPHSTPTLTPLVPGALPRYVGAPTLPLPILV